jgi:hypothetical protein
MEHSIGQLCVGGDWACAHGDLAGLAHVAEELAARAHEPLHCQLVEVVRACRYDPDRAPALWFGLRPTIPCE